MKLDRRKASTLLFSFVTTALFSHCCAKAEDEKPPLTRKELKALLANAKTASDHRRIAAYYRDEAKSLTAKQREHEEDLQEYYKNSSQYPGKYPTMGDHCRELAGYYGLAVKKAQALADMHEQLAKRAETTESTKPR